MSIEQALFTSVRGARLDGYQLVAASAGFDEDDARELARWCPTHDSLLAGTGEAESLNFHRLESGRYCLSRTTASGEEYSERGGNRVETWLYVFENGLLARFANHPFRVYDALSASGPLGAGEPVPSELPALSLVGGAAPFDATLVAQVSAEVEPRQLARLVDAVQSVENLLAVSAPIPLDRLLSALLYLLPLERRLDVSFCTGLKHSASRPVSMEPLPSIAAEQRQLVRQANAVLVNLKGRAPEEPLHDPWAKTVERALCDRRLHWLARQVRHTAVTTRTIAANVAF